MPASWARIDGEQHRMSDEPMRQPYEACPLCDSKDFGLLQEHECKAHALYDPGLPPTMRWCLCRNCTHCFVDAYLTKAGFELLAKRTHAQQDPTAFFTKPKPTEDLEQHRIWSAAIISRVTDRRGRVPRDGEKWLDVGFGNGSLLFTAWEWGYHPIGVDLRQASVEVIKGMSVEAHHVDFVDYAAPAGSLAVISMADVLEHMPFPKAALRHARTLLADDGVIFLSMPNFETLVWKYWDSVGRSMYWYEIEHCHNFGRPRLYALLAELGFAVIDYQINQRYRSGMDVIARKQSP